MAEVTDAEIAAALARGEAMMQAVRARTVVYDADACAVLIDLTDGTRLTVPVADEPSLAAVDPALLATVKLRGLGFGIQIPALDIDLSVASLRADALVSPGKA